ncbi:ABC transporter substrate-binding protein [Papillibacter cinnamivorans]|uniref:Putative ABC transport system substrate-binding protein n=1 Tax=Papillibacter cinnamivorans DSM 12816 TaxID=1122930 RepID=A0A1W1ZH35_9FIRM|nr:ABC transporter substrate-binding protein [Papillibacter cinnamivorans]SMC47855.1 putative ABC transport system substrate-binding protein [Papillibacter cinnamivorans DSM 12816]
MKKTSRLLALSLALAMVLALAGCTSGGSTATATPTATPAPTEQASFSVGIIQYVEHAALDASREGFVQALADNGYVEGQNLTLDLQNAQADQNNLKTISQRFVNNKVDLILAIATPAAQAMASETTEIPILGTAITDYVAAKLVDSNEAPGGNVSGTTDMNPVKEQIDLLVKLVPDVKTVGILYTSSEDNSVVQANMVKEACEALNLAVEEATVTSVNDVQQAAQSLVGKVDAIYIPTDNILASAMPVVSTVTNEAKIPTICGESNMVLAGGLATLGINYYNLGYQTGEMAVRLFKGEAKISEMPIESLTNYDFTINGEVAKTIGVTIPEDLQQYVVNPS